ncbi:MAG: hypothetical protein AAF616_02815 [Bacteroidota bacterium]
MIESSIIQDLIIVELRDEITPLKIREKISASTDLIRENLQQLYPASTLVLSTCHRFTIVGNGLLASSIVTELRRIAPELDINHYSVLGHEVAPRHLFCIAAGLNSKTIGEHEILGQIRKAYSNTKCLQTQLHELMKRAIYTGKRIRTETLISRNSTSLSGLVTERIKAHFSEMEDVRILIYGTGEMARLVVRILQPLGVKSLDIASTDLRRASALCKRPNQHPTTRGQAQSELQKYQVIIGATSTPSVLLKEGDLVQTGSGKLLIDLGMPRNFNVKSTIGIWQYNLETLCKAAESSIKKRSCEIDRVLDIISEEELEFEKWVAFRRFVPWITKIKEDLARYEAKLLTKMEYDLAGGCSRQRGLLTYKIKGNIQTHFSLAITVFKSGIDNAMISTYLQDILRKMESRTKKILLEGDVPSPKFHEGSPHEELLGA